MFPRLATRWPHTSRPLELDAEVGHELESGLDCPGCDWQRTSRLNPRRGRDVDAAKGMSERIGMMGATSLTPSPPAIAGVVSPR